MDFLVENDDGSSNLLMDAAHATLCPNSHLSSCDEAIENDTGLYNLNDSFVSSNGTAGITSSWSSIVIMCVTSVLLGILIIATVVGK